MKKLSVNQTAILGVDGIMCVGVVITARGKHENDTRFLDHS